MQELGSGVMLTLVALVMCSGCAPQAVGPGASTQAAPQVSASAAPEDRLVAAIEAQNCVLTADNVETILLQANLTQADLVSITPQLAAAGQAEVAAEGTIRVLTDRCI